MQLLSLRLKHGNGNIVTSKSSAHQSGDRSGDDGGVSPDVVISNDELAPDDGDVAARATGAALARAREVMRAGGSRAEAATAAKDVAKKILKEAQHRRGGTGSTHSGGQGVTSLAAVEPAANNTTTTSDAAASTSSVPGLSVLVSGSIKKVSNSSRRPPLVPGTLGFSSALGKLRKKRVVSNTAPTQPKNAKLNPISKRNRGGKHQHSEDELDEGVRGKASREGRDETESGLCGDRYSRQWQEGGASSDTSDFREDIRETMAPASRPVFPVSTSPSAGPSRPRFSGTRASSYSSESSASCEHGDYSYHCSNRGDAEHVYESPSDQGIMASIYIQDQEETVSVLTNKEMEARDPNIIVLNLDGVMNAINEAIFPVNTKKSDIGNRRLEEIQYSHSSGQTIASLGSKPSGDDEEGGCGGWLWRVFFSVGVCHLGGREVGVEVMHPDVVGGGCNSGNMLAPSQWLRSPYCEAHTADSKTRIGNKDNPDWQDAVTAANNGNFSPDLTWHQENSMDRLRSTILQRGRHLNWTSFSAHQRFQSSDQPGHCQSDLDRGAQCVSNLVYPNHQCSKFQRNDGSLSQIRQQRHGRPTPPIPKVAGRKCDSSPRQGWCRGTDNKWQRDQGNDATLKTTINHPETSFVKNNPIPTSLVPTMNNNISATSIEDMLGDRYAGTDHRRLEEENQACSSKDAAPPQRLDEQWHSDSREFHSGHDNRTLVGDVAGCGDRHHGDSRNFLCGHGNRTIFRDVIEYGDSTVRSGVEDGNPNDRVKGGKSGITSDTINNAQFDDSLGIHDNMINMNLATPERNVLTPQFATKIGSIDLIPQQTQLPMKVSLDECCSNNISNGIHQKGYETMGARLNDLQEGNTQSRKHILQPQSLKSQPIRMPSLPANTCKHDETTLIIDGGFPPSLPPETGNSYNSDTKPHHCRNQKLCQSPISHNHYSSSGGACDGDNSSPPYHAVDPNPSSIGYYAQQQATCGNQQQRQTSAYRTFAA